MQTSSVALASELVTLAWPKCSSAPSSLMKARRPLSQSAWCLWCWEPSRYAVWQRYLFLLSIFIDSYRSLTTLHSSFWLEIIVSWDQWWCARRPLKPVCLSPCLSVWWFWESGPFACKSSTACIRPWAPFHQTSSTRVPCRTVSLRVCLLLSAL